MFREIAEMITTVQSKIIVTHAGMGLGMFIKDSSQFTTYRLL